MKKKNILEDPWSVHSQTRGHWNQYFLMGFSPVFDPTNEKMLRTQSIGKNEFFIPRDHFSISCSRKPQNAIFPTTFFFLLIIPHFLLILMINYETNEYAGRWEIQIQTNHVSWKSSLISSIDLEHFHEKWWNSFQNV